MKIDKTTDFEFSVSIDSKRLEKLYAYIQSTFTEVGITGFTNDNSKITFSSLQELLDYENNDFKKLIGLVLSNSAINDKHIYIQLGNKIYGLSNSKTARYDIKYDNYNEGVAIEREIENRIREFKTEYSFMYKVDFVLFLPLFFSICLTLMWVYLVWKNGFNSAYENGGVNLAILNLLIFILGFLGLVGYAIKKTVKYFAPKVSFRIGNQVDRLEKKDKYRGFIIGGILISFIVNILAGLFLTGIL